MTLSPPASPTPPDLNSPSTYNQRVLDGFTYCFTTLPNWIAGLSAADWFNILGTVSQVGGVPTGAIIERGSNANGEYVRFADGTQICTAYVNATTFDMTTVDGNFYRTADYQTWNLPADFVTAPIFDGSFRRAANMLSGIHTHTISSDSIFYVPFSSVSLTNGASKQISLIAIGRWF